MTTPTAHRWGFIWGWVLLLGLGFFAPPGWTGDTPPPGLRPETVSAGGYHTCGVRNDGTVACWGLGTSGNWPQYGDYGQSKPPLDLGTVTQVSAGGHHTCAVRSDGAIACWGRNDY